MWRWRGLINLIASVVMLLALLPAQSAQAQSRICFAEVPDCIEGRFAEYWQQHGGLPVFGFPITPVFEQEVEGRVRKVQIFERNRFELHPELARPYDVLLGRLGDDLLQRRGMPWQNEPKAPVTQQFGCRYFAETQHLVCDAFLRYWQTHGLEFDGRPGLSEAESLALFGLPLTEPRMETNSSGDTVLTQWFERARFELHTQLGPDVVLLGLLGREAFAPPLVLPRHWLDRLNAYRAFAGLAPVQEEAALSDNCWQHARYMAENNHLTHDQNPVLPYASPAGQICAQKGNAWIGGGVSWQPADPIDGWMRSVGHRLWMLYPTLQRTGFGFYTAASGRQSAAALDVLSYFNEGIDYPGWPVRYPGANQQGVPATIYPITLHWRYFGNAPVVTATELRVVGGATLPHTVSTDLPAGHKGIVIIPTQPLPALATIEVIVAGSYDGRPFTYQWQFQTGW
ncbi:CAP domain-containing protein [Chloroflexus sp.]|uniref:CAP domain-containing protein n=1 Tax=Chloroflexus sp. TaxID=1904827 RepID=UPI002ACD33C2|nr:CAP domain-containing protein [Chloroflexus sp.]